ncbi:MAG: prepilin-type N-terminal cleavage/methylation domain-containing protein [Helicobacteraceae bacterium]|nr:prepilin-type N-terminal cleavage/methylation domain-containing protein [Helicobacteraceae bacterium]
MSEKKAFTLIEVLVSIMIILGVIATLLQVMGDRTLIFNRFSNKIELNWVSTLLIDSNSTTQEQTGLYLSDFIKDYKIDDELLRELKDQKVQVIYEPIILNNEDEESTYEDASLELGKSYYKINGESSSFIRLKNAE